MIVRELNQGSQKVDIAFLSPFLEKRTLSGIPLKINTP
jgi:hypothetical protein